MKLLYTPEEFDTAKSTSLLPLECYQCGNEFHQMKKNITFEMKHPRSRCRFCSKKCEGQFKNKTQTVKCSECDKPFEKKKSQILKSKTGKHFCSRSCSVTHNNKNKKHGTRRSKLEGWLESKLVELYPNLEIQFNQSDAIGSELDIYIPELNLAFELNGIFHYEPIFGKDKLIQIQENDLSKAKACFDEKIDLCIIDTSGQKYFKISTSTKYLEIITQIIDER